MEKLKIICPIAGVGKRLQPFTYSKPKAFLKLAGKTIIDHAMEFLMETFDKGTEILFIVGYKKEMIINHITSQYDDYFKLKFIEQEKRGVVDDIPIFPGLGHAIYLARESGFMQKKNEDNGMFVFLSDRLPIDGFSGFIDHFKTSGFDGMINTSIVKHPEHYGVIEVDESKKITRLVEKPKEYISNIAVSGIYVFNAKASNALLDDLENEIKKDIQPDKEYQFTPSIQNLVKSGFELSIHQMENEILDIGRPSSFLMGNKYFLKKANIPCDYYKISNSQIIQPTFIGKNVSISNSIVGPYVSLGDNIEIDKTIINNAVIADNSSLTRVITSESIIGESSHLEDIIKPKIIVGDRSVIASRKNNGT